jgi:hypothetical protein
MSPENRFALFGMMLVETPRKRGRAWVNVSGHRRQGCERRTAHGSISLLIYIIPAGSAFAKGQDGKPYKILYCSAHTECGGWERRSFRGAARR